MNVRLINVCSRHFLFQFSVFWNCQNGRIRSKMRMFRYLGYRGYFFSDFYKYDFLIFTYSEIRKFGLQKIRNFQTSFRYSPTITYKNLSSKIRDFNTNIHLDLVDICLKSNTKAWITKNLRFSNIRVFDICLLSNTKTWISKIRDFQTSVLSINIRLYSNTKI